MDNNIINNFSKSHNGYYLLGHTSDTGPTRFYNLHDAMIFALNDNEASGITLEHSVYTVRKGKTLISNDKSTSWIKINNNEIINNNLNDISNNYYDIIFSINIHEHSNIVKEQFKNIKYFSKNYSTCIIYNCNSKIYKEIKDFSDNKIKIIINPDIVEKARHTGTLVQGIISNLKLICNNCKFKYFISLSSRNYLTNYINLSEIHNIFEDNKKNINSNKFLLNAYNNHKTSDQWMWPKFKNTLLYNYLKDNNMGCYGNYHEGCCIDYNTSIFIINFLSKNTIIENNIYQQNICMEEFVIHSLANNFKNSGFIIIPNCIKIERNLNIFKELNKKYNIVSVN